MNTTHTITIIGHRGAAGYAPENTLCSFEKAIELGVSMIELDVFCCATGELVVIHDNDLSRTTDGTGLVTETAFGTVRTLDAGNGCKIPTLSEVIDLVDKRTIINIELKGQETAQPVAKLLMEYIIIKGWTPVAFLVSSFDQQQLYEFKKLLPPVPTGLLVYGIPLDLAASAERLEAAVIAADYEMVSQAFVDDAHRRGLKFYVYTVNSVKDYERMLKLNVDGIFTDFPDLFYYAGEPHAF